MKVYFLILVSFFLSTAYLSAYPMIHINPTSTDGFVDKFSFDVKVDEENTIERFGFECHIFNVVADVTTCENGLFNVLINFEHTATSDSFRINGNGIQYGHFAYADLPILLEGLSANCETFYEFGIRDLEFEDCHSAAELGVVCCEGECLISNLQLSTSDCLENNHHTLTIDFDVENPGNAYFGVWVNGFYRGTFLLSTLPLTLTLENTTLPFDDVLVCINDVDNCCAESNIANPCYQTENCHIFEVVADVTTCENGLFNVLINFEHTATSDSLWINGNGIQYGHFAYADLPVLLEGLSANCETFYEFGIRDLEFEDCHSAAELGVVCCEGECLISNLQLSTSDCLENNHHTLTIDFDVENPGNAYFGVWVNGFYRGTFLLSTLPLTLTLENTTMPFDDVLVCINDVDNCCAEGNIANPCYQTENCLIANVVADVTTCENGLFNVLINFEHTATSDSFRINGNGIQYGHFAYADLPVILEGLAANCETNYEFGITDLEHADCHSAAELGVVCCEGECLISNLQLSTSDCLENNHHTLTIDFDVENPGNAYFDVWVNSVYRGVYLLSSLPLTLTLENTTLAFDHVLVCINDTDNCCAEGNITNPCFQSENCHIFDVVADVNTCENGLFNVLINFEHTATSDSFRIYGNGIQYGHFAYADLPVVLEGLSANCETNYEFGIRDLEHADCHSGVELGTVCCEDECIITDLVLTASDCSGEETYTLTIDFNYSNPGNELFDLWFNGWYIGNFNLNTLPFTLTFENSGSQVDTVVVCINDQENCCAQGIIANPCYTAETCHISNVVADVTTCENDLFNVLINFEHVATSDSFRISGNGVMYGHFAYADLPVVLEGLSANCETNYEFGISDLEHPDCHCGVDLGTVCCEDECIITDLVLTASDCTSEEEYMLTIDFNYSNAGNNYFDLWINGEFIGYFNLSILPFSISVDNSGLEADNVLVCIHGQEDCCADGLVQNPCNPSGDCSIFEPEAAVMACENELFDVLINFGHRNTSESFRIRGNGVHYGNFAYTDLPVLLEGLEADCSTQYEFVIIDLEDESCRKSVSLGKVCCEPTGTSGAATTYGNFYYVMATRQLILDFRQQAYDEVIVTRYNVLGQKLDRSQLSDATGIHTLDIQPGDPVQFARIELYRGGRLTGSEIVRILNLR